MFLYWWDARLARETERDMGFQFQRFFAQNRKLAKINELFVRTPVSGRTWQRLCTLSVPVKCIHDRLPFVSTRPCEVFDL